MLEKFPVYANRHFIAFHTLFWTIHSIVFYIGWVRQRDDPELMVFNSIGNSILASRGAGLILSIDCCIMLLSVCRNTISQLRNIKWLKFVPFDDNLYLHKWTAYSVLLFSLIHTISHYANFFVIEFQLSETHRFGSAKQIHYGAWAGVTGHIMIICMFLIYTSARQNVRQRNFETFWYTHHLFLVFYICLILHSAGCFVRSNTAPLDSPKCKGYNSIYGTLPTFVLYLCERALRVYRSYLPTKIKKVIFHPGNTLEIQFVMPSFKYKPGQYLFINIPEVSSLQWHPYTISSTPEEDFISVHIRLVGEWTKKVAEVFDALENGIGSTNSIKICIDGPYGSPADQLYKYKVALLIGAGIGVTPAASLLKSVWYRYYLKNDMPLKKLYFYWISRDAVSFSWFQSLLAALEDKVPSSNLEIHIYLTGRQGESDIFNIAAHDGELDPITSLQSKTHYGRPNWAKIFTKIRLEQEQEKAVYDAKKRMEIACFYCGPKALAKTLLLECRENSSESIFFDLKKEKF